MLLTLSFENNRYAVKQGKGKKLSKLLTNHVVGVGDLAAGVEAVQEYFKMADGFNLFCRHWKADGESKRSVICIHGIGGHSGFFRVIGPDLAREGINVYAPDLRGFGNSKEEGLPRGDVCDFNRHLQDVDEVVSFVRKRHRVNKVYMFGWSLGTLYTLWYSATHRDSLDGIILAAPYWVGVMPRIYTSKIAYMLRSSPKTIYDSYKNWSQDFEESEEGKILLQDPLFTTKRSWRWLSGVKRNLSDKALQNASQTKKPTLIILGEQDDTSIRTGAKQILESLATKDKSIHTFPDADHFFHHGIFLKATAKHNPAKRKQVTSVITDWLNTH